MAEIYEQINSEEILITNTSESTVLINDLRTERRLIQEQIDALAEQMAIIDSKLAVIVAQ